MLVRPARQHRLEAGGRRGLPRRARHQVLPASGRPPEEEAGPLDRRAELVETTRLFGRGIANIEPQWLEEVAGHLLKKQLLDPHWEKKAARSSALERATLYGLVVIYSGRRVTSRKVDPQGAREIFIREGAGRRAVGDASTPSLPPTEAGQAGRGAGTQVAPAGRAGRRRTDLRLLRRATAARRASGADLRALVREEQPRPSHGC
jgi:hypothetical protein